MCRHRNRRRRRRLRRAPVACDVGPPVVGLTIGVGRIGCLSLLTKSLSMESHFKQSCAVASQIVSFVRSLSW